MNIDRDFVLAAMGRTIEELEKEKGDTVSKQHSNFGTVGQPVDEFERQRISSTDRIPMPVVRGSDNPYKEGIPLPVIVREVLSDVRRAVNDLAGKIEEQNRTLQTIDVPLEQVAGAHERASSSFETLRAEIQDVSRRIAGVEGVIDTAGLMRAHAESAELLSQIGREVKQQLDLTRDVLTQLVEQLIRLQGEAIETARQKVVRMSGQKTLRNHKRRERTRLARLVKRKK